MSTIHRSESYIPGRNVFEKLAMDAVLFAKIAKVLSDPQRFAILERIAREPECACLKIVEEFPITQATISHHLKELAGAELVDVRREGKCAHFTVKRETIEAYQAELARRLTAGHTPKSTATTGQLAEH